MPPRRSAGAQRSTPKIALLLTLVILLVSITSMVLSSYPQHLYIDNKTVLGGSIGFMDNNTVNIRGHQVQYGAGDSIGLSGRDYVRITGRQVQMGSTNYTEGIRTVSASITQNVLFEQKVGTFTVNQTAQVSVDGDLVNITPLSTNVMSIRTEDSTYNIEFIQDMTYIVTKNKVMLKLQKKNGVINVFVVGVSSPQNIWTKVVS